ncbi:hypothetical protein HQ489_00700 [Candidatus Woesearchaeota archaeon]|nr:hypothetical protein [Candidatus Woesearchaeota archaeon]
MTDVPISLRRWFFVHFLIDFAFGIPLFFKPSWILAFFGITTFDPMLTRLIAAALFAIGGSSLLAYHKTHETYHVMINLKLIWSITSIAGLIWSIQEGGPPQLWSLVVVFTIFTIVWIYYKVKLDKRKVY